MKTKRIAIYGVTEESISLLPQLLTNPEIEVAGIHTYDMGGAQLHLQKLPDPIEEKARELITSDERLFESGTGLHAVIDSRVSPALTRKFPFLVTTDVECLSPLVARLLWGFRDPQADHKQDLLQTLQEIVESYDLTIDTDELFERMLQIAIGATGADQGSLMILEPSTQELLIRMAVGIERELWPKIRVRMGEGIAGKVAADASPLLLRGHADHMAFHVVHERSNAVSAISVPLQTDGRVLGVLNLHHSSQPDIFTHKDLEFVQQLAALDAALISKAQEFDRLRSLSARYSAGQHVRALFRQEVPVRKRLRQLCCFTADQVGDGIVSIYLHDADRDIFTMSATSQAEEGHTPDLSLTAGSGVDGQVAESGEPIYLRLDNGSLAYAAMPLASGQLQVGVMTVQISSHVEDTDILEGILGEITTAAGDEIANMEREEQAETQLRKMRAIGELGIRLLSAGDNTELVQIATHAVPNILEAEFAVVRLRDAESGRFYIRGGYGSTTETIPSSLIHLDKLASREAATRSELLQIRDLRADPRFCGIDPNIRSILAAPITCNGQIIGTFAIYNKLSHENVHPGPFHNDDAMLFEQVLAYMDRAVSLEVSAHKEVAPPEPRVRALPAEPIAEAQPEEVVTATVDETLEGFSTEEILHQRIAEEIARAAGRPNRVVVLHCDLENIEAIAQASGEAHAKVVVEKVGEALRSHMRTFDVLAQTGDHQFTVLLPDPGEGPEQRLSSLARTVTHEIAKHEELNEPIPLRLAFGYALHPRDGRNRKVLLERATTPRIRVV